MEQIFNIFKNNYTDARTFLKSLPEASPTHIACAIGVIFIIGAAYAAGKASSKPTEMRKPRRPRKLTVRTTPATTSLVGITYNIQKGSRDYRRSIALERELNNDFLALPPTPKPTKTFKNPSQGIDMDWKPATGAAFELISPRPRSSQNAYEEITPTATVDAIPALRTRRSLRDKGTRSDNF